MLHNGGVGMLERTRRRQLRSQVSVLRATPRLQQPESKEAATTLVEGAAAAAAAGRGQVWCKDLASLGHVALE